MANQDLLECLDVQDSQDSSASPERLEIQVTWDVRAKMESLGGKDLLDPKVIKETLLVVLVHLETRGLLETSGPQDFLDLEEILEDLVSTGLQDRKDAKEIQASRETWANQVWSVPRVPEVVRVFQVFLVKPVLMVHQDRRAPRASKVLLDHLDFMDWTD